MSEAAVVIEQFHSDRPPTPVTRIEARPRDGVLVISEADLAAAGYVKARPSDAVDCMNPDHWFDSIVGWPGKHDGGLPDFPQTPCKTFAEEYGQ